MISYGRLHRDVNYDLENNASRNVLSQRRSKSSDFSINYIRKCSICSRLSIYQVFFQMVL